MIFVKRIEVILDYGKDRIESQAIEDSEKILTGKSMFWMCYNL